MPSTFLGSSSAAKARSARRYWSSTARPSTAACRRVDHPGRLRRGAAGPGLRHHGQARPSAEVTMVRLRRTDSWQELSCKCARNGLGCETDASLTGWASRRTPPCQHPRPCSPSVALNTWAAHPKGFLHGGPRALLQMSAYRGERHLGESTAAAGAARDVTRRLHGRTRTASNQWRRKCLRSAKHYDLLKPSPRGFFSDRGIVDGWTPQLQRPIVITAQLDRFDFLLSHGESYHH